MDFVAEHRDPKLREWKPGVANQVRQQVVGIMNLADHGVLDLMRSRSVEQEVLGLLDEPMSR